MRDYHSLPVLIEQAEVDACFEEILAEAEAPSSPPVPDVVAALWEVTCRSTNAYVYDFRSDLLDRVDAWVVRHWTEHDEELADSLIALVCAMSLPLARERMRATCTSATAAPPVRALCAEAEQELADG